MGVIRTVTILDVQWKKSRSFFALVLKLKAEGCVCSSAFILCGPYILSGVQMKRKKKKKRKKNTIFARGSQPSEIVGVLYRMKMRRKWFSTGRWWGRAFSSSGVGDGSEKKRSSDPQQGVSRGGCYGSAVFMCNSLLLSQSPSVPLLQCSSFMHPPGWQSAPLIG